MRISRKTSSCLNCGHTLNNIYNFCPNCGQGNHNDNVTFSFLVGDFFSTYFAIDSKFGKSVKPFFFKPGFLTNEYIKGKRASYANPMRLYLIISIFYFFTVNMAAKYLSTDEDDTIIKTSNTFETLDEVVGLEEPVKRQILLSLSDNGRKQLKNALKENDLKELQLFLNALDSTKQFQIRNSIGDSIANSLQLAKPANPEANQMNENLVDNDIWIVERIDFDKIDQLEKNYKLTDRQIYDSLNLGSLSYFEKVQVIQAIRLKRAKKEQVLGYVANNLPIMMLVLIPLFALVLKLLYIRRKELYIKHLIHGLHLHSFAYLVYGLFLIITVPFIPSANLSMALNLLAFIVVSLYTYLSFKRVYQQHWFKTLVKFFLTGGIYLSAILVFFLLEMVVSLLLY